MNWPLALPADEPAVDDMVVDDDVAPDEPLAALELDGLDEEPAVVDEPDDPVPEPAVLGIEEPLAEPDVDEPEPTVEEPVADGLLPGCMAEDPEVVEPEPAAVGRSVPPDGAGAVVDWAKAGAVASAVATRQAAICVFSISFS
jgi:hypothetical protein